MKCMCNNGNCKTYSHSCSNFSWNRQYDPDYGRKMDRFVSNYHHNLSGLYRKKSVDSTMTSVVKD